MRAWFRRLWFGVDDVFVLSCRRVVFAAGEPCDYENGSAVVRHAQRARAK
jgi:hypothetical protein